MWKSECLWDMLKSCSLKCPVECFSTLYSISISIFLQFMQDHQTSSQYDSTICYCVFTLCQIKCDPHSSGTHPGLLFVLNLPPSSPFELFHFLRTPQHVGLLYLPKLQTHPLFTGCLCRALVPAHIP